MAKGKSEQNVVGWAPQLVGESLASSGYSRLGKSSGNNTLSDRIRLNNLADYDYLSSQLNHRDAISLCRSAYRRFPPFTTTINIFTDLSNTQIHLKGGNSQSVKFIEAWLKRINSYDIAEQFFRETYLSGSIFFQRFDANLKPSDILKMGQVYASDSEALAANTPIPIKYALLDAANVTITGISDGAVVYSRVISKMEFETLRHSSVKEDKETYRSIKDAIKNYAAGATGEAIIELDPKKLHVIFYQKQDYENFATPMGYCVLDDINLKMELRKADAILARCVELSILLVTAGEKESEGGVDPVVMDALKKQFQHDKAGRVLVSDYTTKIESVIPDIASALDPKKYADVNASISGGLMNIFFGEQKFADSVNKLRAITKKIENAQKLFLTKFLNPEIKRVSKLMGFKAYPTAIMEPVRIDDQTNMMRIYAQLMQMGILSPKDGLELIETGIIPDYASVETNQESHKQMRDKGYFQPVQGGPFDTKENLKIGADIKMKQAKQAGSAGRPSGTKSPQTTKKVSQVGASYEGSESDAFNQKSLVRNTKLFLEAKAKFESAYKDTKGIRRITDKVRSDIDSKFKMLCKVESPESWASRIDKYVEIASDKLDFTHADRDIAAIASEFEVDEDEATILYHSRIAQH